MNGQTKCPDNNLWTKLFNSFVRHHGQVTRCKQIRKIRLSVNEIRRNLEVDEKQFWPKNVKNLKFWVVKKILTQNNFWDSFIITLKKIMP